MNHPLRSLLMALAVVAAGTAVLRHAFALPVWACWLIAIGATTFLLMGKDKLAAQGRRTRTPEFTLYILALLGGTPSILLGQALFKHKSSKPSFIASLVGIIALQLGAAYYFFLR